MTAPIVMLIALGALAATMTGGVLALKLAGKLPLVMGFSAGAVIGVAFFDLGPEALNAGIGHYTPNTLLAVAALGFFLYTALDRLVARHDCEGQANPARGLVGAASFSAHSVLDGFAMGVAFQASHQIGLIVEGLDVDARGEAVAVGGEPALRLRGQRDRARRGLAQQVDQHRVAGARAVADELGRLLEPHLPELAQGDRRSGGHRDGQRLERREIGGPSVRQAEVELGVGLQQPDR